MRELPYRVGGRNDLAKLNAPPTTELSQEIERRKLMTRELEILIRELP